MNSIDFIYLLLPWTITVGNVCRTMKKYIHVNVNKEKSLNIKQNKWCQPLIQRWWTLNGMKLTPRITGGLTSGPTLFNPCMLPCPRLLAQLPLHQDGPNPFTMTRRRHFCPKRLTVIHTYIHTLMVVAAMKGADQHIGSSLGLSILSKDTVTCRPGESTSDLQITRCWLYPWATVAKPPVHLMLRSPITLWTRPWDT